MSDYGKLWARRDGTSRVAKLTSAQARKIYRATGAAAEVAYQHGVSAGVV